MTQAPLARAAPVESKVYLCALYRDGQCYDFFLSEQEAREHYEANHR